MACVGCEGAGGSAAGQRGVERPMFAQCRHPARGKRRDPDCCETLLRLGGSSKSGLPPVTLESSIPDLWYHPSGRWRYQGLDDLSKRPSG
eukprot:352191-Chlamydomonas_euryale.AAC.1